MLNQSESLNSPTNSLSQLVQNMFSDNNNNNNNIIMLAAIICLLLVILFVLLLHVYAKWFLIHSNSNSHPRRRQAPVTLSDVPISSNFHHFNISPPPFKGLDSKTVSMIPMFMSEEKTEELECVICLSYIEKGEIGRKLPKCGHVFHVECIDMWLSSHCNCPICRSLIVEKDCDGVVEIVIDDTPRFEISESGSVSISETSLSLLSFSLKKILSKVFMSSHVNELDGSQ